MRNDVTIPLKINEICGYISRAMTLDIFRKQPYKPTLVYPRISRYQHTSHKMVNKLLSFALHYEVFILTVSLLQGSIVSAIGGAINAVISAIANVIMTIVSAIVTVRTRAARQLRLDF